MKDALIYALIDPDSKAVRYVGKTVNLKQRVSYGHLSKRDMNDRRMHKANWLRGLAAQGKTPEVQVLETVAGGNGWQERERHWIAHYRDAGAPLTNMTDGGDGGGVGLMSPEARKKQGDRLRGVPRPPEVVEKLRAAHKGTVPSPQCREAQRAACTGLKQTRERIEHRVKHVKGNRYAAKYTYVVISPTGEVHDVGFGLSEFCKEHRLDQSRMRTLAQGDPLRKSHKGWTCQARPISKGAAVPA